MKAVSATTRHAKPARLPFCALVIALVLVPICFRSPQESATRAFDDPSSDTEPRRADMDFFESKIRPVLVEHCYACHSRQAESAGKLRGGLRVDDREALRRGGDSGPAIVPRDLEASLLIAALRHDGSDYKMPPSGRLPAAIIADFESWIGRGAPDPRQAVADSSKPLVHSANPLRHWAYQPTKSVAVPAIETAYDRQWIRTDLDSFIAASLRQHNLARNGTATSSTLLRRLSFDLRGLPPSPEELDDFLNHDAPDAWERSIDRWLASPRFGERWGRHWLDVARFAESLTLRGFILPEAWRYRDYVMAAWNADRSLGDFIREQIAGDLLPHSTLEQAQRQRVATTFLAIGNTNLEEQDKQQLVMDVVDEQLDVISKAFLAQTVTCARCHDHKFDPIATRDYYALAGILRNCQTLEHDNVSKWLEFPLPVEPALEAELKRHEQALATNADRLKSARDALKSVNGEPASSNSAIVALKDLPGIVVDDAQAKRVGDWMHSQHTKPYVGDGYLHDRDESKGQKTLTFIPELPRAGEYEVRFAYTPGGNRSPAVPVTVFSADGEKTLSINQQHKPAIDGVFVSLGRFRFEPSGQSFVIVDTAGTQGHVIADAVQFLPLDEPATAKTDAPKNSSLDRPDLTERKKQIESTIAQLEAERKKLQQTGPQRPMFMSVRERGENEDAPIHKRGSVHLLGERVPRGVLPLVGPPLERPIPSDRSGRRELAEWLASADNPLTARVFANRLWHWTMGSGLVRSTDNFGTTGDSPTHPELLEHLAFRFREGNESPKRLIRRLVTSATYQLTSDDSSEMLAVDPENHFRWRMPRRRMDAECIVNALLASSGELDLALGGPTLHSGVTADYGYQHQSVRRAEYWPVLRNSLPDLFEAFDFADPSVVTGRRDESVIASQSLALLNQPRMASWSQQAAQRVLAFSETDETRIDYAFRLTLGRVPSTGERDAIMRFLQQAPVKRSPNAIDTGDQMLDVWSSVMQSVFASIDFRYLD